MKKYRENSKTITDSNTSNSKKIVKNSSKLGRKKNLLNQFSKYAHPLHKNVINPLIIKILSIVEKNSLPRKIQPIQLISYKLIINKNIIIW